MIDEEIIQALSERFPCEFRGSFVLIASGAEMEGDPSRTAEIRAAIAELLASKEERLNAVYH